MLTTDLKGASYESSYEAPLTRKIRLNTQTIHTANSILPLGSLKNMSDKVDYQYFLAEPVTHRTLNYVLSCLMTADSRKAIGSKLNFMTPYIALK